ncbi:hypothetical protein GCM10020258_28190 [Sphingomonas yabuuchiae]
MQQFRPGLAERDLTGRGGGLRILQARPAALGQAQPTRAQRDCAGRDDRDLLPGAYPCGDVGDESGQPVATDFALGRDEEGRADLDDQPLAGGGGKIIVEWSATIVGLCEALFLPGPSRLREGRRKRE